MTLKPLHGLFVALALASSMIALPAFAVDLSNVKESIPLKDGSTVYVFKDGKMGMEDKLGVPTRMKPGHVMETKGGKKRIMIGDEVAQVDRILGTYKGN